MGINRKGLFKLTAQAAATIGRQKGQCTLESELLERDLERPHVRNDYTSFERYDSYLQLLGQQKAASLFKIDNPFFKKADSFGSSQICIENKNYLNFSSYNYLDLAGEPRVNQAAVDAISEYGTSVSGSRMVSGEREIICALERQISEVYGCEEALVFVSGYATNVSTIATLFGKGDLVLYDELSHNSILTGIQLSGATKIMFKHNSLSHLESALKNNRANFKRALIVGEGLYSMDGDLAPLKALVALKERYHCFLMMDEAHALGVLGKRGLGSFEEQGVCPKSVDIWMGTLSKTLAASGGYIAGSRALITILKYSSPAFVYSVGISPPVAAAALCALNILIKEPERVSGLQKNSAIFLNACQSHGLNTGNASGHAIIPLMCKSSKEAVSLSEHLFKEGVYALPIIYPAVPEHLARVRFFINSSHTEAELTYCVRLISKFFA